LFKRLSPKLSRGSTILSISPASVDVDLDVKELVCQSPRRNNQLEVVNEELK